MRALSLLALTLVAACGGESQTSSTAVDATAAHDAHVAKDSGKSADAAPRDAGHPSDAAFAHDSGVRNDAATPRDATATGDGGIGSPCSSATQCSAATCLGAPFSGGYCTVSIAECSGPGGVTDCPDGAICDNGVSAVVNGVQSGGDFCLTRCAGATSCRPGYSCCSVRGYTVCAPASLCGT